MVDNRKDLFVPLLPSELYEKFKNNKLFEDCKKSVKNVGQPKEVEIFPNLENVRLGVNINTTIISEKEIIFEEIIDKESHDNLFKSLLKKEYSSNWDGVFGKDYNELKKSLETPESTKLTQRIFEKKCRKFKKFLREDLNIDWMHEVKVEKVGDETIRILSGNCNNKIDIKLYEKEGMVTLKISGDHDLDLHFEKGKDKKIKGVDNIDSELFSKSQFDRSIYKSNKPLKISFNKKTYQFYLYISQYKLQKLYKCCSNTFTLTTFGINDTNEYLSNKEVINLSKWCVKKFNHITNNHKNLDRNQWFTNLFNNDNSIEGSDDINVDDTFRSIQFWCIRDDSNEPKGDARNIITKDIDVKEILGTNLNNMYYFYSILTQDYKSGLLRRHFKNIADVIGYCQSVSNAYFDVFYGNICLEVTIKPKSKVFQQIGHDSEEFRIWEILALQKHIVKHTEELRLKSFNDLEDFFDFRVFTKKLEKGGSWINYARHLQVVTGIRYYYKIHKNDFELKEREREKTLQKLNFLIYISIFVSLVAFFQSIIDNNKSNSSMTNMYYNFFLINSNPELKAILVSVMLTALPYLIYSFPKKPKELKLYIYYKQHYIYYSLLVIFLVIFFRYILVPFIKSRSWIS